MTNTGPSTYGPATGKKVLVRTIADCFVQEGLITQEWLIRDTLPVVSQLGFEPAQAAQAVAGAWNEQTHHWLRAEHTRIAAGLQVQHPWSEFAQQVLGALWQSGDAAVLERLLPHYALLYPDPLRTISGRGAILAYAQGLRDTFAVSSICVDHVAAQPWAHTGYELAVRWSLCATHTGDYLGLPATSKPVYILGSSHWRVQDAQVLTDWTVFDGVGVLAQLV